jgi:hypothetical protein
VKSVEDLIAWYKDSRSASTEWREEARESYDLVAGHQWTDDELAYLEEHKRPAITVNRIAAHIDMIVGHHSNNVQTARFIGKDKQDNALAEMYTSLSVWIDTQSGADDELSDAVYDLLVTGMAWLECRTKKDGSIISAERIEPLECYWDMRSKKRNITDAQYVFRGRWVPTAEAEAQFPKLKSIMESGDPGIGFDGGKRRVSDPKHTYETDDVQWTRSHDEETYIIQAEYWEISQAFEVRDNQSGQVERLSAKKMARVRDYIDPARYSVRRLQEKTYYQAFIANGEALQQGESPSQTAFTLLPITLKRDVNKNSWYGVVRNLKDPQRWGNKFFCDIHEIIARNRKGGAFVEEDAFVDPRKAEEDWNNPSGIIRLKKGALSQGKIMERDTAPYPAGLDRLMTFVLDSIPSVSGLSQELLGLAGRDQPGVLELQRKKSSLTILAPIFASIQQYLKARARVVMGYIRDSMPLEMMARVLGEDAYPQLLPALKSAEVERFDIIVDTAPTALNQQEMTFAVLMQILPLTMKIGYPVPIELMDHLPLPKSLIESWKAQMEQANKQRAEDAALVRQIELRKATSEAEATGRPPLRDVASMVGAQAKAGLDKAKTVVEIAKLGQLAAGAVAPPAITKQGERIQNG